MRASTSSFNAGRWLIWSLFALVLLAVPLVFTKFPSCLVGPNADVELRSDGVDYEGELVVVIGTGGKDIAKADAWSHVAGLTIGQDISDRPAQFAASPPHFDLSPSLPRQSL